MPTQDEELKVRVSARDDTRSGFAAAQASVKAAFGEGSALGVFAKAALGAGAVAGLAAAVRVVGELAGKYNELNAAVKRGALSQQDMNLELVKSLPLMRMITDAAENLANVFTGGAFSANNNALAAAAKTASDFIDSAMKRQATYGKDRRQKERFEAQGEFAAFASAAAVQSLASPAFAGHLQRLVAIEAKELRRKLSEIEMKRFTKVFEALQTDAGAVGGSLAGGVQAWAGAIWKTIQQQIGTVRQGQIDLLRGRAEGRTGGFGALRLFEAGIDEVDAVAKAKARRLPGLMAAIAGSMTAPLGAPPLVSLVGNETGQAQADTLRAAQDAADKTQKILDVQEEALRYLQIIADNANGFNLN